MTEGTITGAPERGGAGQAADARPAMPAGHDFGPGQAAGQAEADLTARAAGARVPTFTPVAPAAGGPAAAGTGPDAGIGLAGSMGQGAAPASLPLGTMMQPGNSAQPGNMPQPGSAWQPAGAAQFSAMTAAAAMASPGGSTELQETGQPGAVQPADTVQSAAAKRPGRARRGRYGGRHACPRPVHRGAALGVLCVTVLIANLDNTILNVALPTLARDLDAGSSDLQWVVDSYMIVYAGLLLTAGSLADRIGRKRTFLAGLALFAGGSAWATFSGSAGLLIAARAGMGVGGALMMPSTLSIISDMYRDPGQRQRAISMWAATSGFGVALGPILGGLLLAHYWWGSVFLVNVPIAVAGLAAAVLLVPESRNPDAQAPDLPGTIMSIAGIALVLWAIIEGPTKGWGSREVLGAGAGGLAVLACFALWERLSRHPMLHLGFFRDRAFGAAIPAALTVAFALFGALFVLTQFLQFSLGYSPLAAGVRVLPAAGAIVVVAPLSAVAVRFLGPKITMGAGLALIAGGLWVASGIHVTSGYGALVPGLVLLGAGAGLCMPTASGCVIGSVPPEHTGVASATYSTALQVGGAVGVAVVGSLLSTRYDNSISAALARAAASGQAGGTRHLPPAALEAIQGSLGGALEVAARLTEPARSLLAHAARAAFASGLDLGMLTGSVVAMAGFVLVVIWLPRKPR